LVGREQEIVKLDQELSAKLSGIQAENNKQLLDSVISYLNVLNESRNYDFILNAGDILLGDENSNITSVVLESMNGMYNKTKGGK
jgi:outer membrane protein